MGRCPSRSNRRGWCRGARTDASGEPPRENSAEECCRDSVMDQFNAWHPLWAFEWDGERDRKRLLPKAAGRFVLPYTPNAPPARIEFTDVQRQRDLIAIELADLAVSVGLTPLLPGIVLGKSVLVMLPVGVTSHGPVALASARLTSTPKVPQGLAVSIRHRGPSTCRLCRRARVTRWPRRSPSRASRLARSRSRWTMWSGRSAWASSTCRRGTTGHRPIWPSHV